MRRILVDHARAKLTDKRGAGGRRVTLAGLGTDEPDHHDLLTLDEALVELARLSARQARLVELRFFGGLSLENAAEELGIARSTAIADWRLARAWLNAQLS